VLTRIAADEQRHAELAWHFVAWALQRDSSLVEVVNRECRRAVAEFGAAQATDSESFDTAPHGVLSAELRAQVRRAAVRDVVVPCMDALVVKASALVHAVARQETLRPARA
jgi:xanthine/CO dehydrogenase XdhC/CoxF family maturation factor